MIFEACAPTRNCEKPVKTVGFYRFFVGRGFFEKVTAVDGNSTKTMRKSTIRTTKIASKSSQDRRKSLFGALRERFEATKVTKTKPRTPKSGPRAIQGRPKRPFGGPKAKTIHQIAKTILQIGGCGGYAEAGGGVRGGKLPEFGG